jgi:hypothetical protein
MYTVIGIEARLGHDSPCPRRLVVPVIHNRFPVFSLRICNVEHLESEGEKALTCKSIQHLFPLSFWVLRSWVTGFTCDPVQHPLPLRDSSLEWLQFLDPF